MARPSPGGVAGCSGARGRGGVGAGAGAGAVRAGGAGVPSLTAPPARTMPSATSAAPPRSAAAMSVRRRRLDRRDLLVLGHAEGRAAAARGHDVRVVHLEAGALERVDVVDARAVDVRQALVVDEDTEAVVLEDGVAVALVVEREVVLEARAAAAADADAQSGDRQVGVL